MNEMEKNYTHLVNIRLQLIRGGGHNNFSKIEHQFLLKYSTTIV